MVAHRVNGSNGVCGFTVDDKLGSMVESMYFKGQICDNIVKFSGGGKL
jgi:hypothetical protein